MKKKRRRRNKNEEVINEINEHKVGENRNKKSHRKRGKREQERNDLFLLPKTTHKRFLLGSYLCFLRQKTKITRINKITSGNLQHLFTETYITNIEYN